MSILAKHCLVWTLLLAVSVQGIAAVLSAVRGPAHVHAGAPAAQAAGAAHEQAPSRNHHAHPGAHHSAEKSTPRRAGHFQAVQALAAGHAPAANFPHRAHHHDHAQRHYHLPGSDAVLVYDGSHTDPGTAVERTSRSESVSPVFVAVISEDFVFTLTDAGATFANQPAKKLISCSSSRIERPPRLLSA